MAPDRRLLLLGTCWCQGLVHFDITGAGHPGLADPTRNASRVVIATFSDTTSVDVAWQVADLTSDGLATQFGPREVSSLRTKAQGGFIFVCSLLGAHACMHGGPPLS